MCKVPPTGWEQLCLSLHLLRLAGKEMVDYICQYLTSVRDRRVSPDVQPGYMRDLLPARVPIEPESWDSIFKDIEKIIMPGVSNQYAECCILQKPKMHSCRSLMAMLFIP